MEIYLAVVNLALAVATIVPLLWPGGREKLKVVWVGAGSLLLLFLVLEVASYWRGEHRVKTARRDIIAALKKDNGLTLDEIFDGCYVRDSKAIQDALDELVDEEV